MLLNKWIHSTKYKSSFVNNNSKTITANEKVNLELFSQATLQFYAD